MAYTTYCTRFDNRDKEPSLFPFLQPYEQDCENAEYIYNQNKKSGKERENSGRKPDGRCLGAGYREPIRTIDYGTDRISYYQQRSSLQW